MTYTELREEAEELAEIWGFKNARRPPDWSKLVNRAYRELAWAADAIKGPEQTFETVIDQAEYVLPEVVSGNTRDWKTIDEAAYDGTLITPTDVSVMRRIYGDWLATPSGTPTRFIMLRPNVMRLYPTPNAVKTVRIFGIQEPVPLVNETDEPLLPEYYHSFIPVRAAYHHAKKYAKGADMTEMLARYDTEFQAAVGSLKREVMEEFGMEGWRVVAPIDPPHIQI